jgi:hypothetical protein
MLPEPTTNYNHLVSLNPHYKCSQCGGRRVRITRDVFEEDGSRTVWGVCADCDNRDSRVGEETFDPVMYPRWNVIKQEVGEHIRNTRDLLATAELEEARHAG